jgi:hypothetical protein
MPLPRLEIAYRECDSGKEFQDSIDLRQACRDEKIGRSPVALRAKGEEVWFGMPE